MTINKASKKWTSISLDEQETLLNFDYFEKKLLVYTTRQPVANRLKKKLGEPTKETMIEGKIASNEWTILFENREAIKKILSINNFVSQFLSQQPEEEPEAQEEKSCE